MFALFACLRDFYCFVVTIDLVLCVLIIVLFIRLLGVYAVGYLLYL